jgi:hypothetical protein
MARNFGLESKKMRREMGKIFGFGKVRKCGMKWGKY